ncbi:response regulator [Aureimonas leprariae]|uniref:Response regulator n=1 Tax=Plantimonas leprariae TaxID=2615207 RepID=A0A7V7PSK5_9HYPH|nr:response regulator [Aureimonas leprariae]KAB0682057.1 response regulator [Aureimonas leprariae]
MSRTPSLSGSTVLVVEDDYYLADDARQALERAGATVLGPCASADDALAVLQEQTPDCAVVDINLGTSRSFDLARTIKGHGIAMLFVTGYDASAIPPDLADIPCLQKPLEPSKLTAAITELRRGSRDGG